MTAQNSNIVNAFETTLAAQLASGGTTMILSDDPGITSPAYLVVDPDSDSAREVIEWTAGAYNNATVSRDLDSKHGTDPTHASGTKVRLAVVKQHIKDIHERLDDIAVTGAVTGTLNSGTQDIATTLASGIDATKIADGTVSDAEFQYLNGVTSGIQTQIDALPTNDSTDTFTNKSIDLTDNTLTGTFAEFNTAVSDATLVDLDDSQTLTNKAIDSDNNTITNIVNADIKAAAAIDATKIADGSVTSAEFQYIGGLTSDAQTQLDSKATTADTLDEFGNPVAALDINDQELTKFIAKDFAEDLATTSDSGTSFTSNTLTLDVQDGNVFSITLNDNVTTWAINNLVAGKATTISVILKQDGTGSRLMNATQINSTTFKTVGAGGLTLTTTASAIDIVSVVFDGTDYFVFSQLAMG